MKPIIGIGLVVVLLGVSCRLPQRTKTFIPPTNERDLCKMDDRFVYAAIYDYCFRKPDQAWEDVINTGHRDTAIASVTSDDFFVQRGEEQQHLFTMYVGPASAYTKKAFVNDNITVVRETPRYLIGYIIDPEVAAENSAIASSIIHALENLYFFTPDGTRQADEP